MSHLAGYGNEKQSFAEDSFARAEVVVAALQNDDDDFITIIIVRAITMEEDSGDVSGDRSPLQEELLRPRPPPC